MVLCLGGSAAAENDLAKAELRRAKEDLAALKGEVLELAAEVATGESSLILCSSDCTARQSVD